MYRSLFVEQKPYIKKIKHRMKRKLFPNEVVLEEIGNLKNDAATAFSKLLCPRKDFRWPDEVTVRYFWNPETVEKKCFRQNPHNFPVIPTALDYGVPPVAFGERCENLGQTGSRWRLKPVAHFEFGKEASYQAMILLIFVSLKFTMKYFWGFASPR